MKLTVVVCTYNRSEILKYCLDSLAKQTVDKLLFEVIVVDNNSTDKTKEVVEEYCRNNNNFRYVFERVQGLSNARNRGWKEAKADWIAYIDDDAKADEKWCLNVISIIKDDDVSAFGGKILPWYERPKPEWFRDEFETRTLGEKVLRLNKGDNPFGLNGSNMIFRKDILEKYQGFPNEFGMKGEEIGLAEESKLFYDMLNNKETVYYFPKIVVYHLVQEKSYSFRYKWERSVKSGEAIARIRNSGIFGINFIKKVAMFIFKLHLFFFLLPAVVFNKKLLFKEIGSLGYFYGNIKQLIKVNK